MPNWLPPYVVRQTQVGGSYSQNIGSEATAHRKIFDLCTPDGVCTKAERINRSTVRIEGLIKNIHENFQGFVFPEAISFNLKSSLSQMALKVDANTAKVNTLDKDAGTATFALDISAVTPLGILTLDYVIAGTYIGKLFCADPKRVIIGEDYVERAASQVDLKGTPLLSYGKGGETLNLKRVGDRVVAFLPVTNGTYTYSGDVHGFLPTIGAALSSDTNFKRLLRLHQQFHEGHTRVSTPGNVLMVRTQPLHMRTMFARVVKELLPEGLHVTGSDIIEPTIGEGSNESDDRTFVFYGDSKTELTVVPVEFFSLESYREHVSFSLRKSLAHRCGMVGSILKAFKSMPRQNAAATFVCKGSQFDSMTDADWVVTNPVKVPYVGAADPIKQLELAENYLFQQCEYAILSAISVGDITSDGVLLLHYFPTPLLKSLLLSRQVIKRVKAIYFLSASRSHGSFFSHEDAGTLRDISTFGISVFFVDEAASTMHQFILKVGQAAGMFVPLERRSDYLNATCFGVYGSNLVAGDFEHELHQLLAGLQYLQRTCKHPFLNAEKPLALVTGGGPGAMEVGNRVAKSLGILSCGMFVDFGSLSAKPGATINEQKKNPYVEAFMTYRPDKLVERQSDFNLDFPIFLTGGIGTDFEYALEEVRRKVGSVPAHPLVLFGTTEHWGGKLSGRYHENKLAGTIKGSEWMSNVPWICQTGKEALAVFTAFFEGRLPCGPAHPGNDRGYMVAAEVFPSAAGKH
eukprot:GILI01012746.1.p1 GENE.GILI01012746.1~~GILI01012746.1.p1  ORF type:complete len:745 (+),score=207.56 GILI01012746.1:157-2391(+)